MTLEYQHLVPTDFNDNSKIWIYHCGRMFGMGEALDIEDILNEFTSNWKSHGATVKGFATLFFGRFIVIMADESQTTVGGCSTDSSVHIIKKIEQKFNVDLFNRQSLAFVVKDKIEILPLAQLEYAIQNNFITADTLYFNNLVVNKRELLNNWIIPVEQSWLKRKLPVDIQQ